MAIAPEPGSFEEDWQLLAATARGESEAFAPLIERHQDRLIRLCERLLGDREEARDAAQEVFLRVFRHAGEATARGQFYTWLYRIALNYCFNRLRRRKIVRFLSFDRPASGGSDELSTFEPADGRAGAEEELLARERWRQTRQAIDALPAGQRSVLLLARFEGLSQKEIAETLEITEGAVESRLVRAMRRLARLGAQETADSAVPEGEG